MTFRPIVTKQTSDLNSCAIQWTWMYVFMLRISTKLY